jgi:hypothetical protein
MSPSLSLISQAPHAHIESWSPVSLTTAPSKAQTGSSFMYVETDLAGSNWDNKASLLYYYGVTRQAFQYDPRAQLAPASQPAAAVTRPLHSINL